MRSFFDGMQIKTKLVMIIVITSLAALLIQAAGFIVYERMRVKEELVRDLSSLARIVADELEADWSKVKVPVAMATMREASSSLAVALTNATERVTWKHSARAEIRCPGVAGRM